MAIGKLRSGIARRREQARNRRTRGDRRRALLEALEQRQLLAAGPQLIGVQPDSGDLITDGSVRQVSPRELVFRFDENQEIHPDTLESIRITRSGGDGSFGHPTATSDFGSAVRLEDAAGELVAIEGGADIQLTGVIPGRTVQVAVTRDDSLSPGAAPSFSVSATPDTANVAITVAPATTARQLIEAINSDAAVRAVVEADLRGGSADAVLMADPDQASLAPIRASESGDEVIEPAYLAPGEAPNQNEVIARFAGALPDDHYQIEVFGFDDPDLGITGLRNTEDDGTPGELLVPRGDNARQETINFRLDLGAQVTAVVPQPVVREEDGSLRQRRNEVVVYFNDDDLFVEYERDANGNLTDEPTTRSAEHPRFYSLILTRDTVNNRDDLEIAPSRVVYNPSADTATLIFEEDELGNPLAGDDLVNLFGGEGGTGTFRLRVGTAEPIPLAPQRIGVDFEMGLPVGSTDLGTAGPSSLVLRAGGIGGMFEGLRVEFTDNGSGGPEAQVSPDNPRLILVDLGTDGSGGVTFQDVADAINADAEVAALIDASVDGPTGTAVPSRDAVYAPVNLVEPGDTFEAAADIGAFDIQDGNVNFRSIIISGSIDPVDYRIELPGGNDDPAHPNLPPGAGNDAAQHINDAFGADAVAGVTTVPYNFQRIYGTSSGGNERVNAISERERARIRQALDLWSRYLGVQFVETADRGLTFATGDLDVLDGSDPNVVVHGGVDFGVRVDPDLATAPEASNGLLVLDALRDWNDRYGEDYFRTAVAGIGTLLGLEQTTELPTSTVMALSAGFLNGTSGQEPVFPGAQDLLHGQHLWRPEGGDVDLYRFEVALDDPNKVGLLTAESFAERLAAASSLDTTLTLYRETQATRTTDFGLGGDVQLHLEAVRPGLLGNRTSLQFVVTPSGDALEVEVSPDDPNAVVVYMSDPSALSFQDLADAINADPQARELMRASVIVSEDADAVNPSLDGLAEDTPAVSLTGGGIEALTRNDDYFSEDSFLEAELSSGVYYIGVAASGNDRYDPTIEETGYGGTSEGAYDLQLKFRPQVDRTDVLRDLDGNEDVPVDQFRMPGTRLDGDADGVPGGVHNFWFQTRSLERRVQFTSGGDGVTNREVFTATDFRGITRRFQFIRSDAANQTPSANHVRVSYDADDTPGELAEKLAAAIDASVLQVSVSASAGGVLTFEQPSEAEANAGVGQERSIDLSSGFTGATLLGRTILVDKTAGPQADGSLARPFNNINSGSVANAFAATEAGDIVRIVGNGGVDQDPTTVDDNFAYEIGFGTVPGQILEDGTAMEVPHGVNVMVDAGAVFKMRRSYIGVGSTNLLEDRSGSVLQVLGTPKLLEPDGRVATDASGRAVSGNVFFTSLLDESIGFDRIGPTTTPQPGDWGGILFRRDLDRAEGRPDLADQGIFLQHVGHADIRYGGGKNVLIDSVQRVVNPIEIIDRRPTIVSNHISLSADAAISATPDSFEETNFQSPLFQAAGVFTADYDRVGPEIQGNRLEDNSINGLFIRAETQAGGTLRELTVAGRFDDTDIVHVISENVVISGTPGGLLVDATRPSVELVTGQAFSGGELPSGTYEYRVTMVDAAGNESVVSAATDPVTVGSGEGSIVLEGLPPATGNYTFRRIYRSRSDGLFDLVGVLDASDRSFEDRGGRISAAPLALDTAATEATISRLDASLTVDPGMVVKLEGARIEVEFGAQLLAEGRLGQEVVFTSKLDDRFGAGGEFDTDNDESLAPSAGNWGGIYVASGGHVSLDHSLIAYAGGLTRIEGTFKSFSPIELHQGTARITNSVFQDNDDGQGGQGPANRLGRLDNTPSTIFVRGSQPVVVGNTFVRNEGSVIDIDANSLNSALLPDVGRQSGPLDRIEGLDDNRGPLVRRNRLDDNELNGMEIRGRDTIQVSGRQFTTESGEVVQLPESVTVAELTTESVWDDTDMTHVLFQSVVVGNFHGSGGLRLQSRPGESLVVKLEGRRTVNGNDVGSGSAFEHQIGTGITATGSPSNAEDRVGGTVQIVGQPGAPVVLTSLKDDSVGAGLQPDGTPQTDTNNDGFATRPEPNDWRSILLDEWSNDRNVEVALELESATSSAPGSNGSTSTAQVLGELAGSPTDSDENLRLGFSVEGFLSEPADVDVYSFTGLAGTEVWLDIDQSTHALDSVLELLDADGNVLARSTNSAAEANDPDLLDRRGMEDDRVGPLQQGARQLANFNDFGQYDEFGSTNPRDAGFRAVLPGVRGSRSVYHVRVRSASVDAEDSGGGLTSGAYKMQVRMQEEQEFPGSTVRHADIRYAKHGVHVRGLPKHSPLLGEAQEDEQINPGFDNDSLYTNTSTPGSRAQYVGNILNSDRAVLSVGGSLSGFSDVDFYQFDVRYGSLAQTGGNQHFPAVFDVDYADGIGRPDTNLSIFYDPDGETGPQPPRLVMMGTDSNVAEDRRGPLEDDPAEDFQRGSVGEGDPFIGSVSLPEGTYYAAVTEAGRIPSDLANNTLVRLEPVNSVLRLVDDALETTGGATAEDPKVPIFIPRDGMPTGWTITTDRSTDPGHGRLEAFDNSRPGMQPTFRAQTEAEPNNTFGQRHGLNNASFWNLDFNPNIGDDSTNTSQTIPHTSVIGRMDDFVDLYSLNVSTPGQAIIDIDNGFAGGSGSSVDLKLILLDGNREIVDESSLSFTSDGAGGSQSGFDPYLQLDLDAGDYTIAVVQEFTDYDEGTQQFSPPLTFDVGSYELHVSLEGHPTSTGTAPPDNESVHFDPSSGATPGELTTNAFDLSAYAAHDQPMMYFTYFLDADPDDEVRVIVSSNEDPAGQEVVGPNAQQNFSNTSSWRQLRVPLEDFAGHSGVRVTFEYDNGGTAGGAEGLYLDDFIVGFAERGELVTGATLGVDSFSQSGTQGSVTSGQYQLEMRPGSSYAMPNAATGDLDLQRSFDTNDRQAEAVTLVAPAGNQLRDGDFFTLGDGATSLTFEFDDTGSPNGGRVELGRIRVPFDQSMSDAEIAGAIIRAINSDSVQAVLDLEAASSGGSDTGSSPGDNRINLFGKATGDFEAHDAQTFEVEASDDAEALAAELVGDGVQLVPGSAMLIGGSQSAATFRGGRDTVGIERGVLLTSGDVDHARGPNLDDYATGTASGAGDPAIDNEFGANTVDHTALEFDIDFSGASGPQDLFLELAYASEEYTEDATIPDADIAAVFLLDDAGNQVAVSREYSTDEFPSGSPEVTPNDPNDGGGMLREFGYDGVTRVQRFSASGLDPAQQYRVRIVVADNESDDGDSAVFVRGASLSTTDPGDSNRAADEDGRVTLPALVFGDQGDENVARDQGQVLIHSNFISDAEVYGVWVDPGDRSRDPEDLRNSPGSGTNALHPFIDQPALGPSPLGAVRNLRTLNDSVEGGLAPGAVISNNVIDSAGVSGIEIEGATRPIMISPSPGNDPSSTDSEHPTHFGARINDGLVMVVDSGHTRVYYEFEDIAGAPTNIGGSGVAGGDGVADGHVPIYYRKDAGFLYNPAGPDPLRRWGYTQHEVAHAMRDSILGSIHVTNGLIEQVDPLVGPSLLNDSISQIGIDDDGFIFFNNDLMGFDNPALFLTGASDVFFIGSPAPFDVREAPIHEAVQPFVRVVNNTIYGQDGTLSTTTDDGTDESNDTLGTAVDTRQGRAHTPESYSTTGTIGDSSQLTPLQDVDFYKVHLDVGDRVLIDLDTDPNNAPVDTILRLFDSSGIPVDFGGAAGDPVGISDDDPAPGEADSIDPFIDFTATRKDTYYVAVSGKGNDRYEPFSLASRRDGAGTGDYSLDINVLAPRDFVLSIPNQIGNGQLITVQQVAGTGGQTTEVTFGINGAAGADVNINIPANASPHDAARIIAGAISGNGTLVNHQNGNGPGGINGPLPRVDAAALGGRDGLDVGLIVFSATNYTNFNEFQRRIHHPYPITGVTDSQTGFGHTRLTTSGDGTTELYVTIHNAAKVEVSGGGITLDPAPGRNPDQLLPEHGVAIGQGASPTLLNNVILNTHGAIYNEVTRIGGFGGGANLHRKPNEVIAGGSIFQGTDTANDNYRQLPTRSVGFEMTAGGGRPNNVGANQDDFNSILPDGQAVLEDPAGDRFLPGAGSFAIDSSIDSLLERDEFAALKRSVGISESPILAPARDATGQLRSDDPNVSTPSGLGGNVFKDRGALDRADFVGPSAGLADPEDNDSDGRDRDPTLSVVRLADGTVRQFVIQLADTADAADPFPGSGIDDDTVVGPQIDGLRAAGAVVSVFENGELLEEMVDYSFRYDRSTGQIILTPLAGVWDPNKHYEIQINHRDRFVVHAPAGPQAADGSSFVVRSEDGGELHLEFETGYQLRLPTDLMLRVPTAGGGSGGVADGDRLTITAPDGRRFTFEMDRNGVTLGGNTPITYRAIDSQAEVAEGIVAALEDAIATENNFPIQAVRHLGNGEIFLAAESGTTVGTGTSAISQPAATLGITVPVGGTGPGGAIEGETFTVDDGNRSVTFELVDGNAPSGNNTPISLNGIDTAVELARSIRNAIATSPLLLQPQVIGRTIHLGLPSGGGAAAAGPGLSVTGLSRPLADGDRFTLTDADGDPVRFEFDTDGRLFDWSVDLPATVVDGDTLLVRDGGGAVVAAFEFDSDGVLDGDPDATLPVTFTTGDLPADLADALAAAIEAERAADDAYPVLDVRADGDEVRLELADDHEVDLTVDDTQQASQIPAGELVPILLDPNETVDELALRVAQLVAAHTDLGLTPRAASDGIVALGGTPEVDLTVDADSSLAILGAPGVQANQTLEISGPLVLQLPTVGGFALPDGATFDLTFNGQTQTFEFDLDDNFDPANNQIAYQATDSADILAQAVVDAIDNSPLGITAQVAANGRVELADLELADFDNTDAPQVTGRQGTVTDGEQVTISDGTRTVTFEFENASGGGGVRPGNTSVLFNPSNSSAEVADALAAAINSSVLAIGAASDGNTIVLDDTTQTTVDLSQSTTIRLSGVPGGAVPVPVINAGSFSAEDVKRSIIAAIEDARRAGITNVRAVDRGGDSLFVEGAVTVSDDVDNYFLRAVQDEQGNALKANQSDDVTRFTVLMPGVQFDYGDAPDPVASVPGRYPTTAENDGARHLIVAQGPILGSRIDGDGDGQPHQRAEGDDQSLVVRSEDSPAGVQVFRVTNTPDGPRVRVLHTGRDAEGATLTVNNGITTVTFVLDSDGQFNEDHVRIPFNPETDDTLAIEQSLLGVVESSALRLAGVEAVSDLPPRDDNTGTAVTLVADDEDGVTFGSPDLPSTVFTRIDYTDVQVVVTGTGFLDAWIDFNGDGDWNDPGEQIVGVPGTGTSNVWIDHNDNGTLDAGERVSRLQLSEFDGPVTLKVRVPNTSPIPPAGSSIQTFARFRISEDGGLGPDGLALNGEVEDYAVRIVGGDRIEVANDQYEATEDETLVVSAAGGVLANDSGGPSLQVYSEDVGVRQLSGGELDLRADGSFTFTPDDDFFGTQTFTYRTVNQTIRDETGQLMVSGEATVTIEVDPVNDPPRQAEDLDNPTPSYSFDINADEDTDLRIPVNVILDSFTPNDSTDDFVPGPPNESDQSLSLRVTAGGATLEGGMVRIEDGELVYRAAQDFTGEDQFVIQVIDSGTPTGAVDVTFNVTVTEANDRPVAEDKAVETNEDAVLAVEGDDPDSLLAGASDPDGDDNALRVVSVDTTGTEGTVTFTADGGFTFDPTEDFAGTTEFRYTVEDELGGQTTRTVTVTIHQVDDDPVLSQPLGTMRLDEDGDSEFIDLTDFFTDPDLPYGDSISFEIADDPSDPTGVVEVTLDGPLLEVRPLPNAFTRPGEPVEVTVTAVDSSGNRVDEILLVEVRGENDRPVVSNPLPDLDVDEDAEIDAIRLEDFFSDPDDDPLSFSVFLNSNPNLVTATIVGGQLRLELAPDQPVSGSASANLVIQASDGDLAITDQFQITVNAAPDAPEAVDDQYTVQRGGVLTIDEAELGLLANDSDPDGDEIVIASFTQPSRGTLDLDADTGTFVYTNESGNSGQTDQFTYTLRDATGREDTATVTITIGEPLLSHQNPDRNTDVSGDGAVSPIDALLVINLLNRDSRSSIPVRELPPPAPYYDVDGSATVTPVDALLVINALNRATRGGGEAEGESTEYLPAPTELGGSVDAGLGAVPAAQPVSPTPARTLAAPPAAEEDAFDWAEHDMNALVDVLSSPEEDREKSEESIDSVIEELF